VPTTESVFEKVGVVDDVTFDDLAPVRLGQAINSSSGVTVAKYSAAAYLALSVVLESGFSGAVLVNVEESTVEGRAAMDNELGAGNGSAGENGAAVADGARADRDSERDEARPSPEVVPHEPTSDEVLAVENALRDTRWDFRRVAGIAKSTGLPTRVVNDILKSPEVARRPWRRPTLDLFTDAKRPVSMRERLSLLGVYLAKRP
jgi:hypothetical protein